MWDPGSIVALGRAMIAGDTEVLEELFGGYFSIYQSNLLLSLIVSTLLKINKSIGIFSPEYDIMSVVVVNAMLSLATAYLVYKTLRILVKDSRLALLGYGMAVFLLSFSPWNIIPYSDGLSLIFPILLIYLGLNWKANNLIKWPLLSLIAFVGILIKQTVFIIFFAFVIVKGITLLDDLIKKKKLHLHKPLPSLLAIVLSILSIFALKGYLSWQYKALGYHLNPEKKLGFYHGVLLGQHEESGGTWNGEDVYFSNSFSTPEERERAGKEEIIKRIQKRGFVGQLAFTAKKLLGTFNDGMFAWGVEAGGQFYSILKPELTDMSQRLRARFYTFGEYYVYWKVMAQFLWFLVLVLVFASILAALVRAWKQKSYHVNYLLLLTSLIGIIFLMAIFEFRARYLYVYVPVFILCAIHGLAGICKADRTTQ